MGAIQQALLMQAAGLPSNFLSKIDVTGQANGSTTFPDLTGRVWTPNGDVVNSTALGATRMLFGSGAGGWLTTPSTANLQLTATQAWTYKMRLRQTSQAGFQTPWSKGYTPAVARSIFMQSENNNGRWIVYVINGAGSTIAVCTETAAMTPTVNNNQDYVIEVKHVQIGADWFYQLWRDGVLKVTSSANPFADFSANTAAMVLGGGLSTGFTGGFFRGYIDQHELTTP